MRESMTRRKADVIIISCLDDNIYFGISEDRGTGTQESKAGEDGKEHIAGRLVVGKKDMQEMLFRRMEPILGINTVVVVPIASYMCKPCCNEAEHVANRMEPDFASNIKQDLREVGRRPQKVF
jgi:hypothetical protein